MKSLAQCRVSEPAEIVSLSGDQVITQRLRDLGLVEGATVKVFARLPFGGPLVVQILGTTLALRRGEAECIKIKPRKV